MTVHIEPYDAKVQRGSAVNESEIRKTIYKVVENYRRDLQIKRIVTYVVDRKRYINIECYFSRRMSIEEAHRIAQAQRVQAIGDEELRTGWFSKYFGMIKVSPNKVTWINVSGTR